MADYNVNMKQWNGTSFDNVLPLAYNAKQLGGQSLAEVKQWVQDNGLLLYTGCYRGTGTYGQNNPTTLTFPFEPILLIGPHTSQTIRDNTVIICDEISTAYYNGYWFNNSRVSIKKSNDNKTISWFGNSMDEQCNFDGFTYYFAAIGGYDIGGATEWTITSSGTWTVPRTGRYMLELYGHGGNGYYKSSDDKASGGASCQSYDSVNLTKGTAMPVSVSTSSTEGSNGTSFGNYSVANGGNAVWVNSQTYHAGEGAGNKGATGIATNNGGNVPYTYGTGSLSKTYGYGGSPTNQGRPRAVYLKYLGS